MNQPLRSYVEEVEDEFSITDREGHHQTHTAICEENMILCGESSPVHRPDLSNTTRSVEDHVSQSVTGTTDLIPVDEAITARAPTNSGDGSTSDIPSHLPVDEAITAHSLTFSGDGSISDGRSHTVEIYGRKLTHEMHGNQKTQIMVLPFIVQPLAVENNQDLREYVLSSRLNQSFEFKMVGTNVDVEYPQLYPSGPFIVLGVDELSTLVQHHMFFTVDQLLMICNAHGIHFASSSKSIVKAAIQKAMSEHNCNCDCNNLKYLFKMLLVDRRMVRHKPSNYNAQLTDHKIRKGKNKRTQKTRCMDSGSTTNDTLFPPVPNNKLKDQIFKDWQNKMNPESWKMTACAVCAHRIPQKDIHVVLPKEVDFSLLQNPHLPDYTRPTTYNSEAYQNAILYPKGMHDKMKLGSLNMCKKCEQALVVRKTQPRNALANWHYTGIDELPSDVREALATATMFDVMMVARSRATRITQLYSKKKGSPNYMQNASESQRYDRGNVSIIPQDSAKLRPLLPPDRDEIQTAMAVLFSGGKEKPTAANIKKLSPVLVSKNRVRTIIEFLLTHNIWYQSSGAEFSPENFADLFADDHHDQDEAVPQAVDLCWLPEDNAQALEGTNADYTDRNEFTQAIDNNDVAMEAVGYAAGDKTPQNYKIMKASALAWCLSRKKFIKMQGGSTLLSDRDPAMLTYVFPHLDPWGIVGFCQSNRTADQHISFECQVKNLLLQDNSPFQADPNFAYVCWNIIQKREVNKTASFRTNVKYQQTIVSELNDIGPTIPDLISKWEKNPMAKASNQREKKAMQLLDRLKLVAKELKGSSGYKLCRRNEIRALMKKYSTPALFVTINPADTYHPLLGVLGGKTVEEWRSMDRHQRAVFVAQHPGPAAQFFDEMMKGFLDIIVRHGKEGGGLFGVTETYYGMVEAQGRGTLHCHMLLWIQGNPSPQELRDKMTDEHGFKIRMFDWIESIIKCDLPGMTEILKEQGDPLPRPNLPKGQIDPRMKTQPNIVDLTEDQFAKEFQKFVEELAIRCNWHEHRKTCWKHVRAGEKRGDPVCRMRIDGKTRTFTDLDEDTQSILLKRLHPRINNYNDVVMFLMQCNMDIKYIGSGEAAKALVYYITDYVTKESLATHVGLEALAYAIMQNDIKYRGSEETPSYEKGKSLFVKTVNAMMARQELSHQQVLSHLIGGGDHYKTDMFRLVKWAEIDRYVKSELNEYPKAYNTHQDPITSEIDTDNFETTSSGMNMSNQGDDARKEQELTDKDIYTDNTLDQETDMYKDEIVLHVDDDTLIPTHVVLDYCHRSHDKSFDQLSIWEHAELVWKITKKSEKQRMCKRNWDTTNNDLHHSKKHQIPQERRGRKAKARGDFCSDKHPNYKTHTNRIREVPFIPVLLGNALPRQDRSPEEREQWCRAMVILFKPWRTTIDLKKPTETWTEAFGNTDFNPAMTSVMKNVNIENECKDARDNYNRRRHSGELKNPLLEQFVTNKQPADIDTLVTAALNDSRLDGSEPKDENDLYENAGTAFASDGRVEELVGLTSRTGLFDAQTMTDKNVPTAICGTATLLLDHEKDIIQMQKTLMSEMKKDKRPAIEMEEQNTNGTHHNKRTRHNPDVCLQQLEEEAEFVNVVRRANAKQHPTEALDDVITELNIRGNMEQERAIRIICEHFIDGTEEQMLCHVSGAGGTGKSYVVRAIVSFFKRCGASEQLMLSASTGCAAILINGYTLHALTFLGPHKTHTRPELLEILWKFVKYLVIDEVSMISAHFFNQVSERLSIAKGSDPSTAGKPFGGVNLIVTGDLGQLPPVNAASLFSHTLVKQLNTNITETPKGQEALNGAFLWRQINKVIILKNNERAKKDKPFINLLSRVREGCAWKNQKSSVMHQDKPEENYQMGDYETLLSRRLQLLVNNDKSTMDQFKHAPIVVGEKVFRDALNNKIVQSFAKKTGQDLHWYHADDTFHGQPLKNNLRKRMLRSPSNITDDAIGMLPLVPGMRVMITDNLAMRGKVANGCQGILHDIKYEINNHGERKAICAYVQVDGARIQAPGLPPDVIPIMAEKTTFNYKVADELTYYITRWQLPLLPAYAFTVNKIQGQSLEKAIVDLRSAKGTQALYVMISRATALENLAVLRWFPSTNVDRRLSEAYRNEFERLQLLDERTNLEFKTRKYRPTPYRAPMATLPET